MTALVGLFADETEDATKGIGGVFVTTDCNGVDTHLYDWVIVATWLRHIAEVKDIFLFNLEFFHEMGHTEDFVHARNKSVN